MEWAARFLRPLLLLEEVGVLVLFVHHCCGLLACSLNCALLPMEMWKWKRNICTYTSSSKIKRSWLARSKRD